MLWSAHKGHVDLASGRARQRCKSGQSSHDESWVKRCWAKEKIKREWPIPRRVDNKDERTGQGRWGQDNQTHEGSKDCDGRSTSCGRRIGKLTQNSEEFASDHVAITSRFGKNWVVHSHECKYINAVLKKDYYKRYLNK